MKLKKSTKTILNVAVAVLAVVFIFWLDDNSAQNAMLELLDIQPGAVSIMGLMNDAGRRVRLVVDGEVLRQEYFGCHPCVNTSSLKLRTSDVFEKYLPSTGHELTVVELTGAD